jgi:[acyl-carrier-protein] S-malonyltransferase
MLARARRAHPAAEALADRAAAVLGGDADRYLAGSTTPLETNRDVQIAVFLATGMYLHALQAEGVVAEASAGLSLGEYSHLVHIGALTFEDALVLVSERGRCYDCAPPGEMVTVMGVDRDTVKGVVVAAAARGCVVISNFNAPTQHVLSGDGAAVGKAASTLEDHHGAYTTVIERRVPMHSPMMIGIGRMFRPTLAAAPWRAPSREYLPNVNAAPVAAPTPDDFVAFLTAHVSAPVLWDESMDIVAARYPDRTFVEVGPGAVLSNLLGRAWKRLARARIDALDAGDPQTHFAAVVEALRVCV